MIRYEDVDAYMEARDRVVQAAMAWVDYNRPFSDMPLDVALMDAVDALRSLYADRGLRDPGTPGEQEPDAEQEHGQAVHPGGQS